MTHTSSGSIPLTLIPQFAVSTLEITNQRKEQAFIAQKGEFTLASHSDGVLKWRLSCKL